MGGVRATKEEMRARIEEMRATIEEMRATIEGARRSCLGHGSIPVGSERERLPYLLSVESRARFARAAAACSCLMSTFSACDFSSAVFSSAVARSPLGCLGTSPESKSMPTICAGRSEVQGEVRC